jgi:hypothetical protein
LSRRSAGECVSHSQGRGSRRVRGGHGLSNLGDRERIAAIRFEGYVQKPTDTETFVGKIELGSRNRQPSG